MVTFILPVCLRWHSVWWATVCGPSSHPCEPYPNYYCPSPVNPWPSVVEWWEADWALPTVSPTRALPPVEATRADPSYHCHFGGRSQSVEDEQFPLPFPSLQFRVPNPIQCGDPLQNHATSWAPISLLLFCDLPCQSIILTFYICIWCYPTLYSSVILSDPHLGGGLIQATMWWWWTCCDSCYLWATLLGIDLQNCWNSRQCPCMLLGGNLLSVGWNPLLIVETSCDPHVYYPSPSLWWWYSHYCEQWWGSYSHSLFVVFHSTFISFTVWWTAYNILVTDLPISTKI